MRPGKQLERRASNMLAANGNTTVPRHFALRLGSSTSRWYGKPKETRAFLHRLTGIVAVVEGLSHEAVKGRLADQLAVLLARAGGRALRRRRAVPSDHIGLQQDIVAALCLDP